jgi:hypothetical protein
METVWKVDLNLELFISFSYSDPFKTNVSNPNLRPFLYLEPESESEPELEPEPRTRSWFRFRSWQNYMVPVPQHQWVERNVKNKIDGGWNLRCEQGGIDETESMDGSDGMFKIYWVNRMEEIISEIMYVVFLT